MASKWALSPELTKKINEVASDLNFEIEELRGEFDDKPESWQQGDRGTDVDAWFSELDNVVETLEVTPEEPQP